MRRAGAPQAVEKRDGMRAAGKSPLGAPWTTLFEGIVKWGLLQAWVLRLVGAVEMLAFGAVFLPRAWMEEMHASVGLTDMPKGPVFDSVMRQVSFTYGLHGVALWFIAADVVRYRPLVILSAIGYLLAGPVFFLIDLGNQMPWPWMAGNGGACLLIGILLLGLLWGEHTASQSAASNTPPDS